MTDQNHPRAKRSVRTLAAAAAAVALLAISASAANPGTVRALLYNIQSVIQVGSFRTDVTTQEGQTFALYTPPQVEVQSREGRAILILNGRETDITDALSGPGGYHYTENSQGTVLELTITGSAGCWNACVSVYDEGQEGVSYSFSSGNDTGSVYVAVEDGAVPEDGVCTVTSTEDGITVLTGQEK